MMDLPGIEAFVRTAEQLSFRRAATELGRTPAAISKAVATLEERLGVQLLERTSRKVALTPEGATFLGHCRTALDALQAGRDLVLEASRVAQGRLRLSLPYVLAAPVVRALPRLSARHPRLDLDVLVTDRHVRLYEEEVDVAVRVGALDDSSLVARRLGTPRWATVGSPAYLARAGTPRSAADLRSHTCLKFARPGGGVVEWQLAERRGQKGKTLGLPTRHRIDHGALLVEAAVAGMGLVQAFDFLVAEHIAAGRLVEVLPELQPDAPPIHALCRTRRQNTPKVRALLELLVQTFAGVSR